MSALLGAHVSTAGGMRNAPVRAAEIEATAIQIFTKMPSRWVEKPIDPDDAVGYRRGCEEVGVAFACAHDSYLINLATADEVLRERSYASFRSELERSRDLGLDAVVTHPGNATDGDRERGLAQNAALIQRALEEAVEAPMILLETTAGAGQVLGSTFEELAWIRDAIDPGVRDRVGVCLDTCHVYSAGYDIRLEYDVVIEQFDRIVGLRHLRLFHLNDSQKPFASRKDRHHDIGEGSLGDDPFRRIMTDGRFAGVPKVLETPKGDDHAAADRRNLARLRSYLADSSSA
ncbi:MAG TPA: deoxyribonuclease IV [Longimicrobiaceae bacterium]|nr:deoxyribonuclease IV [Longimicrobiaceae bacterium]